jgi:putative transposase
MSYLKLWVATVSELLSELAEFIVAMPRLRASLLAENLFLRKQLAFYQEHRLRPRPLTDAARLSLVLWSRMFHWKAALLIVKPDTLIGWHRKGFKLFWRWKSRPGRPPLTQEVRELIRRMARENPTLGADASRGGVVSQAGHFGLASNRAQVLALGEG